MRTVPAVGTARVVAMEIVVVFPAPFGPSRPYNSPGATCRSIPSTAITAGLPGYTLRKLRMSTIASVTGLFQGPILQACA
jgi:hypothetical protein